MEPYLVVTEDCSELQMGLWSAHSYDKHLGNSYYSDHVEIGTYELSPSEGCYRRRFSLSDFCKAVRERWRATRVRQRLTKARFEEHFPPVIAIDQVHSHCRRVNEAKLERCWGPSSQQEPTAGLGEQDRERAGGQSLEETQTSQREPPSETELRFAESPEETQTSQRESLSYTPLFGLALRDRVCMSIGGRPV